MVIVKNYIAFYGSFVPGALRAVFLQPVLGLAVILLGGCGVFAWLLRHTEYTANYDDFFRENNNA